MPSPHRPPTTFDVTRGLVVADLELLLSDEDQALAKIHVNFVSQAPGPAILLWGPDSLCLAYNRHFRSHTGMRATSLGRPLFQSRPELEGSWRPKLEAAMTSGGVVLDCPEPAFGGDGIGTSSTAWFTPVLSKDGTTRGTIGIFLDSGAVVEPMRRLLGAVANDLREPLVGVRVVAERLSRLPRLTRERCVEDMDRIAALSHQMELIVDDMMAFMRRAGAGTLSRVTFRPGDLGTIVREACESLGPSIEEQPIRVHAAEIPGLWDEGAIRRILTSLLTSSRCTSPGGSEILVDVVQSRDGGVILIRDDGPCLRDDNIAPLFEPWSRGRSPEAERRRKGAALGLFLARELVTAHGGRITLERSPSGGFVVRVVLMSGGVASESEAVSSGPRPRGSQEPEPAPTPSRSRSRPSIPVFNESVALARTRTTIPPPTRRTPTR